MHPADRLKRYVLLFVATVCAVLLFAGRPELFHLRSFKYAWDLGHIGAFAIWSLLILHGHRRLTSASFWKQAAVVLLFCLSVGGAVELIQGVFGRDPSWGDLGRDVIGGLLAMTFLAPKRLTADIKWLRPLQLTTVVLILLALIPVSKAIVDEWLARRMFPILADFETPFERDRWSGDAGMAVVRSIAWSGQASLRLDLTTETYSGAELEYFPSDWRGYAVVAVSIYNPDPTPVRIVCKIRDHRHDVSGYRFRDRFNRSFTIRSGWNHLSIAMDDIAAAPEGRTMDLRRITGFQIFSVRLPEPRTLYLDHLVLKRWENHPTGEFGNRDARNGNSSSQTVGFLTWNHRS